MTIIQLNDHRPPEQVGAVRLRCALNRLGEAIALRERNAAALDRIRRRLEEMAAEKEKPPEH